MEYIHDETDHVAGLPTSLGGGGDPSPVTAYGVYMIYYENVNANNNTINNMSNGGVAGSNLIYGLMFSSTSLGFKLILIFKASRTSAEPQLEETP